MTKTVETTTPIGATTAQAQPAVDDVTAEAMDRAKTCIEWYSTAHERIIEDLKFAEGDADNGYQWPQAIRRNRDVDKRPCLTMNITRQHNLQIINANKQNKSAIKIRATGGKATKSSADLMSSIIRNIEYRSGASHGAYRIGSEFQVKGGLGWWRLRTDYVNEDSFDQEILIDPVLDPIGVMVDPEAKKPDKRDARYGFVFDLVPTDKLDKAYPKLAGKLAGPQPLGIFAGQDEILTRREVTRVAEYFRKIEIEDKLASFIDPRDGLRKTLRKSKMPLEVWDHIKDHSLTKLRDTSTPKVEWYLFVGQQQVDTTEWPGRYIPLIPVIGEEFTIEGILDIKGHTRSMKDPQRMYNYNASAQVEHVALQSKTPFIAAAKAIEEYEQMWNTANQVNYSVLPYNSVDPDYPDKPLPPPQRQQAPTSAPGFQEGMETAFNQMMMTSGQWQNQMGMMGNERTGAALRERKMQGDTSTFHFQDNYEAALVYTGVQILDLVPKIYDTKRMLKLLSDDNEDLDVTLDPGQPNALQEEINEQGEIVHRILNPTIGEYDVQADVGAAYGTRRQETVEAMTLLLTQAPGLTGIIGDLLLRAMDFKEASEAAERLRRMIPQQAMGKGPSPAEQQLQQRLSASQAALSKSLEQYAQARTKLMGKAEMRDIDVYEAKTNRIEALAKLLPDDPGVMAQIMSELTDDGAEGALKQILAANATLVAAQDPGETAAASDSAGIGEAHAFAEGDGWRVEDPTKKQRHMTIGSLVEPKKE